MRFQITLTFDHVADLVEFSSPSSEIRRRKKRRKTKERIRGKT